MSDPKRGASKWRIGQTLSEFPRGEGAEKADFVRRWHQMAAKSALNPIFSQLGVRYPEPDQCGLPGDSHFLNAKIHGFSPTSNHVDRPRNC
jgi:hypothetical protein